MTTYALVIATHEGQETKAYSTAANAIDDLEGFQAGSTTISGITRDGRPIDEATLRADEEVGLMIDAG